MTSRPPCWCPKQRKGGHVGAPTKSSGNLTLLLCKRFLLFSLKNMAVDHVSENQQFPANFSPQGFFLAGFFWPLSDRICCVSGRSAQVVLESVSSVSPCVSIGHSISYALPRDSFLALYFSSVLRLICKCKCKCNVRLVDHSLQGLLRINRLNGIGPNACEGAQGCRHTIHV